MQRLTHDCLLYLFEWLDLNQRANLRLTSKLFREICDYIKIKRLVIYEHNVPLPGQLRHTGQTYGPLDTVCVFDLNKFFSSPILLQQMKRIQTLVVHGERDTVVDFQFASFDQLVHLELYKVRFADLAILKSPELETLVLSDLEYKEPEMQVPREKITRLFGCREKMSNALFLSGFDNVSSQKIRFLSIDDKLDEKFLAYCAESGLFRSIEHLSAILDDLNTLNFLSDHCWTLKRIDLLNDPSELIRLLCNTDPERIAGDLREDLRVHLFGLSFNKRTASTLCDLLVELGSMFERIGSQLLISFNHTLFGLLRVLESEHDLNEFYKLVNNVSGDRQTIQAAEFYAKFAHCKTITFALDRNLDLANFDRFLASFPHLRTITLASSFDFEYDHRVVELLTQHGQIAQLDLEIWNDLKCFDFLLRFSRLKRLQLRLGHSVGKQLLIRLFENLKHLGSLDLAFPVAADETEQLDAVSKEVNERLGRRFRAAKLVFDAVFHRRASAKFVRYTVVRDGDPYGLNAESENRMYEMIQHKALQRY